MFQILVGNIPYEASEEQLKEIFSEVGPVVSFRSVPTVVHIMNVKYLEQFSWYSMYGVIYDRPPHFTRQ